jgi:hypothetical protein
MSGHTPWRQIAREGSKVRLGHTSSELQEAWAAAQDAAVAWDESIATGTAEEVAAARDAYYSASNAYHAVVREVEADRADEERRE